MFLVTVYCKCILSVSFNSNKFKCDQYIVYAVDFGGIYETPASEFNNLAMPHNNLWCKNSFKEKTTIYYTTYISKNINN